MTAQESVRKESLCSIHGLSVELSQEEKPDTVSDSLYPRQFMETAGMGVAVLTELWSGCRSRGTWRFKT